VHDPFEVFLMNWPAETSVNWRIRPSEC